MSQVSICFVCLGNICRSPTAEGVFMKLVMDARLSDIIEIDSAGTAGYHVGERADARSRMFAQRRGYELSSLARQFQPSDFERFDYVLAMDSANFAELSALQKGLKKASRAQLRLLRDFDALAAPNSSVPDPYFGGDHGFEEVLDLCERACAGLLQHLLKAELKSADLLPS